MDLLLFGLLLVVFYVRTTVAAYCDSGNVTQTGKVEFTERLGTVDYARLGHYRVIKCCASGFTEIEWYRFNETSNVWDMFPWFPDCSDCYGHSKDGQVFQIHDAKMYDNAMYKCVVQNTSSGVAIHHTLHMYIYNCDSLGEGPIFTANKPHNEVVELGSNVTLPCEGYFGCGHVQGRDVSWMYITKDGEEFSVVDFGNQRYSLHMYTRDHGSIMGTNLTIANVQKSDIESTFICLLATDMIGPFAQKTATVKLSEKVEKSYIQKVVIAVTLTATTVVISVVIVVVVFTYWKPQLTIWAKSRLGQLPQRGDKIYDVCLWYCMEDENIVQCLLPELEERRVKFFQRSDAPPGPELQNSGEKLDESAALIVIFSRRVDRTEVEIMNMFINSVGTDPTRGWSRVTVIIHGHMKKKDCTLANSKLLYCLKYPHNPTQAELGNRNIFMKKMNELQMKKERDDFFSNLFVRIPHQRKKMKDRNNPDEENLLHGVSPPASPNNFNEEHQIECFDNIENNMDHGNMAVPGVEENHLARFPLITIDPGEIQQREHRLNSLDALSQQGEAHYDNLRCKSQNIFPPRNVRNDSGISSDFSPQSPSSDDRNPAVNCLS